MIKFSTKSFCTIAAACGLSFVFGSFVSKNLVNSPITISMVKEAERLSGLALVQNWYEKLKGLDLYLSPSYSDNLLLTNLTGNPCGAAKWLYQKRFANQHHFYGTTFWGRKNAGSCPHLPKRHWFSTETSCFKLLNNYYYK